MVKPSRSPPRFELFDFPLAPRASATGFGGLFGPESPAVEMAGMDGQQVWEEGRDVQDGAIIFAVGEMR
jgi:hypothetical protein